ncbi:MAG: hypothetical protein M3071_10765 [Actinomycetota bacterium]|nr:hypothetical protein [Actinomycetota bacterium]
MKAAQTISHARFTLSRHAGGSDRPQQCLDLGGGDLRRRLVAERGQDEPRRRARASLVWSPRLGKVGFE